MAFLLLDNGFSGVNLLRGNPEHKMHLLYLSNNLKQLVVSAQRIICFLRAFLCATVSILVQ